MWLWNYNFSKIFVSIQRSWFLFWLFLCAFTPKYCLILLKFWPEVVSIKTNTGFEKSFNILSFGSNGTHPKFTALVLFGVQFTTRKPKILVKIKTSAKSLSLLISSHVSFNVCAIWPFKGTIGPGSNIKRSLLRLAPLFQSRLIKG